MIASRGRMLGLIAAASMAGLALPKTDDTPVEEPPEPTDDPKAARYVGIDYGAEPGRAVNINPRDLERLAAAQAKRERRALKLAQAHGPATASPDSARPNQPQGKE